MMNGRKTDTLFVSKCVCKGNKGLEEIRYSITAEDCECAVNDMTYKQLKELADFLHEYIKQEEGGAQ